MDIPKCLDGEAGGAVLKTLLESKARRPRRRAGLVASISIHTVVIAGALAASAAARPRDLRDADSPPPIIHYARRDPAPRPTPPSRRAEAPAIPVPGRLPWSGRSITFVPDSLLGRTIDIDGQRAFPEDTLLTRCLVHCERGPFPTGPTGGDGTPATIASVDRAAGLISPPRPRYPEQLRAARVTGRVILRLVVDTLGRVEPSSVVVRESSHDLFTSAVLAIVPALRFVPAEAGGRRVRMLVDLPFEFRLNQ